MALTLPNNVRSTACDAIVDLLDAGPAAGTIQIRSSPRPASAGDAATGTLLATVTLADPAFGDSAAGVAALTDPAAVTGVATGTAAWFRAADSLGDAVFDGSVSATGGGGDLTLASTAINAGVSVDITGGTVTMPAGSA